MKWFISILVFFILFIFLFIALPISTGTKAVGEGEELYDKISYTCNAPREKCAAALGITVGRYDELISRIAEAEKNFEEECDISDFSIHDSFDAKRTLGAAISLCYPENYHISGVSVSYSEAENEDDKIIKKICFSYSIFCNFVVKCMCMQRIV